MSDLSIVERNPIKVHRAPRRGALGLMVCVGAMAVVWLIVLPRVARIGAVREHIQRMEQAGIEVDAMFYTELNWQPPAGAAYRPTARQVHDVSGTQMRER